MQQQTFVEVSFGQYRKSTRRERILDEMNRVVPWVDLTAAIAWSIPSPRERADRLRGNQQFAGPKTLDSPLLPLVCRSNGHRCLVS